MGVTNEKSVVSLATKKVSKSIIKHSFRDNYDLLFQFTEHKVLVGILEGVVWGLAKHSRSKGVEYSALQAELKKRDSLTNLIIKRLKLKRKNATIVKDLEMFFKDYESLHFLLAEIESGLSKVILTGLKTKVFDEKDSEDFFKYQKLLHANIENLTKSSLNLEKFGTYFGNRWYSAVLD